MINPILYAFRLKLFAQTFFPAGNKVFLICGRHSSKASWRRLESMLGHTIRLFAVYMMMPPQSSSSPLMKRSYMTESVQLYSSLPVFSSMNSWYSVSHSYIIPSTSSLSSSLQQIIKLGSISLIIACKINFLRVPRYRSLLLILSSLSLPFMITLILSRQLFLSFIFNNLAANIFYDLWIFNSSSHCLSLSS